jgi:hypothetical protein
MKNKKGISVDDLENPRASYEDFLYSNY